MLAPNTIPDSVGALCGINQAYRPVSWHLAKGFNAFLKNLRKISTASTRVF
tara:strand:+ start:412 stop:564 length:153 start_codon:yes stop_codon:yes gene_type:complete